MLFRSEFTYSLIHSSQLLTEWLDGVSRRSRRTPNLDAPSTGAVRPSKKKDLAPGASSRTSGSFLKQPLRLKTW